MATVNEGYHWPEDKPETDAERLARIKAKPLHRIGGVKLGYYNISADDLDWCIEQAEKVSQWIPVSTPPPEGETVIVSWVNGAGTTTGFYGDEEWYSERGLRMFEFPTHWQEFPSPPEAD